MYRDEKPGDISPSIKARGVKKRPKLMFVVTEDFYFVSHRLPLAVAARQAGYEVIVATNVDRHGPLIRDAGITLCPLPFNRGGVNPLNEFRTLMRLVRLYRQQAPDIVHHVALKPVIYGSLAARLARVRAIVNALGGLGYVFSSMSLRATFLRLLAKPILKLALSGTNSRLIIQNSDDRRRLIAGGLVSANSVRLIRGAGVDPEGYCKAPPDAAVPLIVLPARLLHEKGVGEFVEAARILKEGGINARFALVGRPDSANPASVTQAEVDAWVSQGVVEAWGWQEDMRAIFCESQIVCLPSYHEGLPKALLEAAASGCGIVTTDIPGCREIVQHGETGWLVPPRNAEALAEALREAILLPEKRKQYGVAVRASVAANFSVQSVIRETMAIYGELIFCADS